MDKTNTAHGLEKVANRGKACNLQKIPNFFPVLVCLVLFFYFRNKIAIRWSRVRVTLWSLAEIVLGSPETFSIEVIDLHLQSQKI